MVVSLKGKEEKGTPGYTGKPDGGAATPVEEPEQDQAFGLIATDQMKNTRIPMYDFVHQVSSYNYKGVHYKWVEVQISHIITSHSQENIYNTLKMLLQL